MADVDRFKYDRASVANPMLVQNEQLQRALSESYTKSLEFFNSMIDTELWKGQAYKEFMAFYHLVLQYHAWVSGHPMPSYLDSTACTSVDFDCQTEMRGAWMDLLTYLYNLEDESVNYQSLEGVN